MVKHKIIIYQADLEDYIQSQFEHNVGVDITETKLDKSLDGSLILEVEFNIN